MTNAEIEAIEARAKALWFNEINGPFIAAARTDVVDLLAEVRKLREALEKVVAAWSTGADRDRHEAIIRARAAIGEEKP